MGQSGKLIGKTYTMKCARPSLLGFHRSLQWLQYHHSNNGSWNWKLGMSFNSCFRRHTVNPCCWLNRLMSTVTPQALPQLPWLTDSKWLCPRSHAEEDPECLTRKEHHLEKLAHSLSCTGPGRYCSRSAMDKETTSKSVVSVSNIFTQLSVPPTTSAVAR